jgi:hypothetical protein
VTAELQEVRDEALRVVFATVRDRLLTLAVGAADWGAYRLSHASRRLLLDKVLRAYRAFEDDIFIVAYPKSGTTWTQMIVYQLTTDGNMDIPHIDAVSPHLEETFLTRQISGLPRPRVLKTHLSYRRVPKGSGRYIYMIRDGRDVAVSYWNQLRWRFPEFEPFFARFLTGLRPYGSWFEHVEEWTANRDHLNVHLVKYEDLVADLESGIREIAKFLDIEIDEREFPRILNNCTFESMKTNEAKFNLHMRDYTRAQLQMIRQGKTGAWRDLIAGKDLESYHATFDRRLRNPIFDAYKT